MMKSLQSRVVLLCVRVHVHAHARERERERECEGLCAERSSQGSKPFVRLICSSLCCDILLAKVLTCILFDLFSLPVVFSHYIEAQTTICTRKHTNSQFRVSNPIRFTSCMSSDCGMKPRSIMPLSSS